MKSCALTKLLNCSIVQIVLLDEPTSGLDVEMRKEVQRLLMEEKRDRLIIVSTHYMDEADVLGDQVLILHNGTLLDKASSRLLRKKYGERP